MKNDKAKRQSLAAELALIQAVRYFYPDAPLPLRYKRNEHNKPYLCDYPELHINISHSGDFSVCIASEHEVGIDIQKTGNADFRVAKRFFTEDEFQYIGTDAMRFYELWAKKESYLKAYGTGMSVPLSSFSALDKSEDHEYIELTPPQSGYVMWACVINKE